MTYMYVFMTYIYITYMFAVTKKVYEMVTDSSDDENPLPEPEPKPKEPEPRKSPRKNKQASISSFFKKA